MTWSPVQRLGSETLTQSDRLIGLPSLPLTPPNLVGLVLWPVMAEEESLHGLFLEASAP